eukprot:scaffold26606_cov50-Phaeocystis_antarctica.AAC.2
MVALTLQPGARGARATRRHCQPAGGLAGARWVNARDLLAVVVRLGDLAAVDGVGAWPGLEFG